jgi:hypothetical protein
MTARQKDLFGAPPMPPYVRNSDTSKGAAVSMVADARTLRDAVAALVKQRAARGATCHEVEWALKLSHQTASARIRELVLAGKLKDSGMRRPTASGRTAAVWIAKPDSAASTGADADGAGASNDTTRDR